MTLLRSIAYAIWTYGLMLVMGVIWLPALALPRSVTLFGIGLWSRLSIWGLGWICGLKVHIRGAENVPDGPVLVASKHQSMLDTMVPFCFLSAPCFILKKELMWYPVFGWYAAKSAMVPIDRGGALKTLKSMARVARTRATQGRQIVIFPEGTRRDPGAPATYKPGVALLYRELGIPCVPVALNTGTCWPAKGLIRRSGTVTVEILPPIPSGLDRTEFMSRLEASIETASHRLQGATVDVLASPNTKASEESPDPHDENEKA